MNITILGAGAIGCVYGGFLAGQAENKVTLINTRSQHIESINRNGLIIKSKDSPDLVIKNVLAVTSPQKLPVQDLVMVCVKATVTKEAMDGSTNLVGPSTLVLTLQNGLGNIEKLCQAVGPEKVIGGTTSYASSVSGPGEIILAARGETVIGEIDGKETDRISTLKGIFERANLNLKLTTRLKARIWTKLISNVAINAICALLGIKNGKLLEHPETEALLVGAVSEASAVAKAEGIILDDEPIAYAKKVCQNSADNICSMLQDLRAHKPTEIGVINGAIVELGQKHHLPTPINLVLTNLIKVREKNY
jgi:2-dehydropantoate 2-reductase